jgi:hypothetical protein
MTIRELTDLVDANGLHAAITIAAGNAEQRSRGRRMLGRVLRIHVVTSGGLGRVKRTRPAGRTCHRWRPRHSMAGERYPFRSL